jgi:hypothetical protein
MIPQPFLNGYKYLKNGYFKIIRVISSGKGTLGISLKKLTIQKQEGYLRICLIILNIRVYNLIFRPEL